MKLFRNSKRFQDDDGSASVEFVIVFPVVIGMVLLIFEAGWVMTKMMMLDRGLDIAMRDIRLGKPDSGDRELIKQKICDRARIFTNCQFSLKVQMEEYVYEPGWVATDAKDYFPWDAPFCRDDTPPEGVEPVSGTEPTPEETAAEQEEAANWNVGGRDTNMFLRVCVTHNPMFPGLGKLLLNRAADDEANPLKQSYQLVAFSAFRNES